MIHSMITRIRYLGDRRDEDKKEIINKMEWEREPSHYEIKDCSIEIITKPHTDLWQRTYYQFRNDNAPMLQMKTREASFSFVRLTVNTVLINVVSSCI